MLRAHPLNYGRRGVPLSPFLFPGTRLPLYDGNGSHLRETDGLRDLGIGLRPRNDYR